MNILITGGAGFIGTNLCLSLSKKNKIFCVDNFHRESSSLNRPILLSNNINIIEENICTYKGLALPKIDFIIHCASEPSVLKGTDNPMEMININIIGTANTLELARKHNAKLIFISTNRVYPYKNDFRSIYGVTKLSAEMIINEYLGNYNIDYIINRCGIISGRFQDGRIDQGLIAYWIKQHLIGGKLDYIGFGGEGLQIRDALHVDDLCDLINIQIKDFDKLKNQTFNVGGGVTNSFNLRQLTDLVSLITKKKIKIGSIKQTRKGDIETYITARGYTSLTTGWKPKRNLMQIIIDTTKWMESVL